MKYQIVLALLILGSTQALYNADSPVTHITEDTWEEIKKGRELWFVEFYAPWCGHCKALAPEFESAARDLEGIVRFGAVDMTDEKARSVGNPFGIKGYPTIKFFGRDKSQSPQDYEGGRTAEALVNYGLKQVRQAAGKKPATPEEEQKEDEEAGNPDKKKGENDGVDDGWDKKPDPFVKIINKDNFDELVMNSEDAYFIEFYAPWCKHCKELNGEWSELAKILRKKVKVGKLDVTINHPDPIAQRVDIEGYPTLVFFPPGKKESEKGIKYKGNRKSETMAEWALNERRRALEGDDALSMDGDVYVLDQNNFNTTVYGSNDPWLIEFYAPWCGHCKTLQPQWRKAATQLLGKVKVGKINADDQNGRPLGQRFEVKGFPTIKFWPTGLKSDASAISYDGTRDADPIVEWALEQKRNLKPIDVPQVINQELYEEYCVNFRGVCLITFLPHIYDTTDEERRNYIQVLKQTAIKFKGKPFSFVWSQAGDQFDFEQAFALGSFYPTVLAISSQKKLFAIMKSSFSEKNLSDFVNNLATGREGLGNMRQNPSMRTVNKWEDDLKAEDVEEASQQQENTQQEQNQNQGDNRREDL